MMVDAHRRHGDSGALERHEREFFEGRLDARVFQTELRTISSVMRDEGVEQIDLLKIDAERSEWDILQGIEPADWSKIKQVVMEVHDQEGTLLQR